MNLSTTSWLYWWAYIPERLLGDIYLPRQASLCSLFWRCTVGVPLGLTVALLASPIYFFLKLCAWILGLVGPKQETRNVLTVYGKALHQKICPIIYWEKPEESTNGS